MIPTLLLAASLGQPPAWLEPPPRSHADAYIIADAIDAASRRQSKAWMYADPPRGSYLRPVWTERALYYPYYPPVGVGYPYRYRPRGQ